LRRRVCVIAVGMSKWGPEKGTQKELIQEAVKATYDDCPALKPAHIDGLLCASSHSERTAFMTHLAPMAAELAGIKPTSLIARVELLCGSSAAAVHLAYAHIAAGLSEMVMVVGVEKLYLPNKWEMPWSIQMSLDPFELMHGMGSPAVMFAMAAREHMKKYGTTEEQMALVAVKNRRNGAGNPKAHFQKAVTAGEVLAARPIVKPLKLLDCTPVTDGAAAIVLAAEERAKEYTEKPVYILGIGQASTHQALANMPDLACFDHLRTASDKAYRMAGIEAGDIDVAETHDCFTISEIIECEDLGFCPKGEGGPFVAAGQSDFGGKVVVNPSGGLISCGHPFGATGARQVMDITLQLRGESYNQVPHARLGLAQNISGPMSASTVTVLGRERVL